MSQVIQNGVWRKQVCHDGVLEEEPRSMTLVSFFLRCTKGRATSVVEQGRNILCHHRQVQQGKKSSDFKCILGRTCACPHSGINPSGINELHNKVVKFLPLCNCHIVGNFRTWTSAAPFMLEVQLRLKTQIAYFEFRREGSKPFFSNNH